MFLRSEEKHLAAQKQAIILRSALHRKTLELELRRAVQPSPSIRAGLAFASTVLALWKHFKRSID
jgi:hypothetical protein